jgi:hypothetical protein
VHSHGVTPNPEVIASFHSVLLSSNATYTVGSFTLPNAERVAAVITASFGFRTPRSLAATIRSHSLSVVETLLCVSVA